MKENQPILEVNGLTIAFSQYEKGFKRKTVPVIEDVSFNLSKGKVHALIGASGSGKSLLAHAFFDILPQNAHISGTFTFEGETVKPRQLRGKRLALVPQSVAYLNPVLTVGKQVSLAGAAQDTLVPLFQRYGLGAEVVDQYPHQLSGGMARKVLLMMALSQGAEVIIADEPTPGLDEVSVKAVLADFRKLADNGCAVLMITHDIGAALEIADELSVFKKGRCIDYVAIDRTLPMAESLKKAQAFTLALYEAMPVNGFNRRVNHA